MSSRQGWLAKWVVFGAAGTLLLAGCGDGDDEVVTFNECGDVGDLSLDGEEASPGEACGPCERGTVTCSEGSPGGLRCHDPEPINACGGCDDLAGSPGAQCVDSGDLGQWRCDGAEAVQCEVTNVNACGGSNVLEADPGDRCGPCGIGTYQCDGGAAVVCAEDLGCPEIANVNATEGSRADGVRVTWFGSVWASGYKVYRDGEEIADLPPGSLSFLDEDADPAGAAEEVVVTASTDRTDGIAVTWHAETADGSVHHYQVEIIYPQGTSGLSEEVQGYRGSDVEGFELAINDGEWLHQGLETELFVAGASMATVDDLELQVTGTGWDFVALATDEPTVIPAAEYEFSVRAITDGGQLSDPGVATGQRAYGDLHYHWSASVDGLSEDLDHCDDQTSCTDDDFPGNLLEKDYRFTVAAEGLETATFDTTAAVDLLVLQGEPVDAEVELGESLTFMVQITDSDGEPVAREGVELDFHISDDSPVDALVPDTLITDASGQASASLLFGAPAVDLVVTITAIDDPRISDGSISFGPFDIVELVQ